MAKKPKTPKQFAAKIKSLKKEIKTLEKDKKKAAAAKKKKPVKKAAKKKATKKRRR